ncbi:MAG: YbgC/FadM family acyl-CoA thioesterase [Burkholderiaceae bacterium]
MDRKDFRFFHTLRVRWAEIDMQKIVFNGHYLMYFDTAIADYWRALALPYEAALHELGGDLYVVKAGLEYKGSARYDELLHVGMKCSRMGNSSMTFTGGIFKGDQLLITGELVYVYADPQTQTSKPIPDILRSTISGYEEGQSSLQLRVGDWTSMKKMAVSIRTQVFVEEQKISQEEEWDEWDDGAVHVVACNGMGFPIATGRLLQPSPRVAQIGRMAVIERMRGQQFGDIILQKIVSLARDRGDQEAVLHAQLSAKNFYRRQGFQRRGDVFLEAGIEHIEMSLKL